MVNTNINWHAMSDKAIIAVIGQYIKDRRLARNKTQALTAHDAGVNRWTLGQIENGEPINLTSLIQILRALDLLNVLDPFKFEQPVSPIALAKLEKNKRQRARDKDDDTPESTW